MTAIWRVDEVRAVATTGQRPQSLSVFGDQACLVLDLDSALDAAYIEGLGFWLSELACPVIGVRDPGFAHCRHPSCEQLAAACDVVVDESPALESLVAAIEANPIAAASFVRLLRVTESMSMHAGMDVESAVFSSLQGGPEYQSWLQAQAQLQRACEDGPAVVFEENEAEIQLTLNRPLNRNAMSVEMRDALVQVLNQLAVRGGAKPVLIRGRGKHFSTGGDLAEFGQVPDTASGHLIRLLTVPGRFLADMAGRVSAHLHGHCVGSGIEFPAFAGRVLAHRDTQFSLPEVGMGLIPGAGGCISIARRIGRQRLAWLGITGKVIDARLALEWGLIDEIEK